MLQKYLANECTNEQIEQFALYLQLISKWNKAYNLTSITDPKEMVIKHILDSIAVNPYVLGAKIIDVGAGAGLPGIPLAIINPDKQFTLLDSNGKKTKFLNQVKIELGLNNIEVVHARVEKYVSQNCFHTVITRAFASINDMLMKTKHLCCKDGIFLAMKGTHPEKELAAIEDNFVVKWVKKLEVPDLEAQRHLICLQWL